MVNNARRVQLAFLQCVLLAACAHPGPAARTVPVSRRGADTSLFAAVVSAVPAVTVSGQLRVFIAPLADTSDGTVAAFAILDAVQAEARRASLQRFGVPEATERIAQDCPGVLTERSKTSCPSTPQTIVSIGFPQPATLQDGDGHSRNPVSPGDHDVVVRVRQEFGSPEGRSIATYDYILRRVWERWTVLRIIPLAVVE